MEEFVPVVYPMETVKALEDYHKTKQDFPSFLDWMPPSMEREKSVHL